MPEERRIPSLGKLWREARASSRKMNRDRVIINWKFTHKSAPDVPLQKEQIHLVRDLASLHSLFIR
jgi:hypothetical protein